MFDQKDLKSFFFKVSLNNELTIYQSIYLILALIVQTYILWLNNLFGETLDLLDVSCCLGGIFWFHIFKCDLLYKKDP